MQHFHSTHIYLKTVTSLKGIEGIKNYYPDKKDCKAKYESRCRFHVKQCESLTHEVSFLKYKWKYNKYPIKDTSIRALQTKFHVFQNLIMPEKWTKGLIGIVPSVFAWIILVYIIVTIHTSGYIGVQEVLHFVTVKGLVELIHYLFLFPSH